MGFAVQQLPVSPLERDELGLAEAHNTLKRVLGAIEEYVYVGEFLPDDSYRLVFAGPCRERFLGMSIDAARGAVWVDYVHPSDMDVFDHAHDAAQATGRLDVEYRLVGADGVVRWVRDRGHVRDQYGRRLLDGSILDVTEIKTAREALEAAKAEAQRVAQLDPLTGVFNRRSMASQLGSLGDQPVGVLSIDIDNFKNINDLFGHAAGDAALVAVADGLRQTMLRDEPIFRTGGEEFLIVLSGVRNDTSLLDVAETVREQIEAVPVLYSGERLELTASIGAARTDAPAGAAESLLLAADHALYAAKRAGRNRVQLASPLANLPDEINTDGATMRLAQAMLHIAAASGAIDHAHSTEVSLLAARIARNIEDSPALILRCRLAGLLHDIGKVQLPASVQTVTPEALSDSQWTILRTHPALGEALVGAVPDLRSLAPIIRQHHERYDGTGYPDGLARDQIRLDARIITAADTWITLTTPRSHQAPHNTETALIKLEQAAGTRLDRQVVVALKSVLAEPREINPEPGQRNSGASVTESCGSLQSLP